jgi:hypothetical protein
LNCIHFKLLFQTDEKEKTSRSRYNGRQFLSWIKDVEDKFEKIKVCACYLGLLGDAVVMIVW